MKYLKIIAKDIWRYSFGWIGSRYIYREIVFPFIYSILVVTFVLLTNFLVRTIDKLLGKGLPIKIIFNFLYLNMAWIIALSVPMATLVAILMAYGRLSEDNEIIAMRAGGINFISILSPGIVFGVITCIVMIYFNNNILPEFNHRARLLTRDIYRKRPDLDIEPGYFVENISGYSIYVSRRRKEELEGVVIYSPDREGHQVTIYADRGKLNVIENSVIFDLFDGEIHELDKKEFENYRILKFKKHRIVIPVDNLTLKRTESGRRGDREMTIKMMKEKIKEYEKQRESIRKKIIYMAKNYINNAENMEINHLIKIIKRRKAEINKGRMKLEMGKFLDTAGRIIGEYQLFMVYQRQINRYLVEIHKKFSIPFACIVFVLVGAPLGIMVRKGGMFVGATLSIFFFVLYYVFLIGGEELADYAYVSPFWAMWTPNLLLAAVGAYLIHYTRWEQKQIEFKFIKKILKKLRLEGNSKGKDREYESC